MPDPEDQLPRVDPLASRPRHATAYAALMRTPPGRWFGINVATRVDPWLMRATRGRVGLALVLPSALLTSRGAKSGAERVNPVLYFHDGDDVILVASSFGRDSHPAWYHNLKANPDVRLGKGGGGARYRAVEVADDERARVWALADRIYPPFDDYRRRAGASGRTIPLVRLVPT